MFSQYLDHWTITDIPCSACSAPTVHISEETRRAIPSARPPAWKMKRVGSLSQVLVFMPSSCEGSFIPQVSAPDDLYIFLLIIKFVIYCAIHKFVT